MRSIPLGGLDSRTPGPTMISGSAGAGDALTMEATRTGKRTEICILRNDLQVDAENFALLDKDGDSFITTGEIMIRWMRLRV